MYTFPSPCTSPSTARVLYFNSSHQRCEFFLPAINAAHIPAINAANSSCQPSTLRIFQPSTLRIHSVSWSTPSPRHVPAHQRLVYSILIPAINAANFLQLQPSTTRILPVSHQHCAYSSHQLQRNFLDFSHQCCGAINAAKTYCRHRQFISKNPYKTLLCKWFKIF